jgi:hypothetical protein
MGCMENKKMEALDVSLASMHAGWRRHIFMI